MSEVRELSADKGPSPWSTITPKFQDLRTTVFGSAVLTEKRGF